MSDTPIPSALLDLLTVASPSGGEQHAAARWRREAAVFARVTVDASGNSFAGVSPTGDDGAPRVLLAGHLDEIGVIVTHIDDRGFVSLGPIGGWDAQVLVGQRVRFRGPAGEVVGVVGKKAVHLQTVAEREKASQLKDLWVDLGTSSKRETEDLIQVGDAGVIDAAPLVLPHERLAARGLDNRVGAYVVLEALRRYAASPGEATVIAAATVQEEIGCRGARMAADRINPDAAIVVDVTHAMDVPGQEVRERGDVRLGDGPALARGGILSPVLTAILHAAATERHIPLQVRAYGGTTSTDADSIQIASGGVATALVGIPNRYMHSPSEMVSLADLDRAADLLAAACRRITRATDFSMRGV